MLRIRTVLRRISTITLHFGLDSHHDNGENLLRRARSANVDVLPLTSNCINDSVPVGDTDSNWDTGEKNFLFSDC